jgi:hypothetical protein
MLLVTNKTKMKLKVLQQLSVMMSAKYRVRQHDLLIWRQEARFGR